MKMIDSLQKCPNVQDTQQVSLENKTQHGMSVIVMIRGVYV